MRPTLAAIAFLLFFALSATIVENGRPTANADDNGIKVFFSADKFDAKGYVDSIWDSRVIPYMKEKAVDVVLLRDAIRENAEAAGERYGYRAGAEQNPYSFAVAGRATILSANVKSKNGRLMADVQPYDGVADIVLQVGPVFRGTSIRDMLDFVSFDDFTNQVEFAKLATELNLHAGETAVSPAGLPGDGGVGREFDFVGAATPEAGNAVFTVTPVVLTPVGE